MWKRNINNSARRKREQSGRWRSPLASPELARAMQEARRKSGCRSVLSSPAYAGHGKEKETEASMEAMEHE